MLTGQAKTDYQRDYMRRRRAMLKGLTVTEQSVRPKPESVRPTVRPIKEQSYNPMMVGYVPPRSG